MTKSSNGEDDMVKINRAFVILFAVLAVFLLSACSKKKSTKPEPEPPKYKWTILGYFDGNNEQDLDILTNGSYVIQDVQEMEQVGSTEDVQIIVMLGSAKTEGNCNYYLIEKHLNELPDSISSEILDSLGKKDMSNPQILKNFIEYGVEQYSAAHYILIINDHGSGWRGVCADQQNGYGEMMSLPELSGALSGHSFDIILFNAPSMSMLEVAYQLKDKADYLVASHFKLPMQNILGSSEWLQDLTDNPDISSEVLANRIVDKIYDAARDNEKNVHIAAIKLSKVDELASKVADLGNALWTKAGAYWSEVLYAFTIANDHKFDDSAFADLKQFADTIRASTKLDPAIINAAQAVVKEIPNNAVIKSLNFPPYDRRGGLSIHFPLNVSLFDSTHYVELDFKNSDWHVFLSHLIPIASSSTGLDIQSLPDGADIFLNGEYTGRKTNTIIDGLFPGKYTVKVVKEGYREQEKYPTVIAGQITLVGFKL